MKRITKIAENSAIPGSRKKLRVAAYCRVSTDSEEQRISLEAQKAHYESYIKSNEDWEYAGLYYDEGISGTKKDKRDGLLSLIADCEKGKIDLVLTKSISRFARNIMDCLELVRKLLDRGISIYFEKENLNTGSMESELMLSILSSLAEGESVSISENNKWSIQRRFRNGTFIVSYPPYGYENRNGEMVINEEQAKVVRFIFDEILAGESAHKVAVKLQEQGVPTKKGGTWTETTIRGILANEKYVGDILFQKTYTDCYFNRHINHGEVDQYYMKDHHEAIIRRDVFEKAQLLVEQNGREKGVEKGSNKYNKRYPFTGKIICGECGTLFRRRIHSNGRTYVAWCCKKHIQDKEQCSMQFIRESEVEFAFVTMMNKLIYGNKWILKPLLQSLRETSRTESFLQIQALEEKLEKNTERRQTLMNLMTNGYLEAALFHQENNELLQEAEELRIRKERLSHEINGEMTKTEEVSRLLKFTEKAEMLTEFDANIFEAYVDHITVLTRNEIAFELKCGLSLKERV